MTVLSSIAARGGRRGPLAQPVAAPASRDVGAVRGCRMPGPAASGGLEDCKETPSHVDVGEHDFPLP
ncbi:MAG: hypothetical protein H6R03_1022, partial [Burkholderiaceae bacterium]|nr:hypothetical protein [Burkholderiaceae bacterium]